MIGTGGISYEYSSQLLLGLAAIRCQQLDSTLIPVAVWDEKPGDGPGGTASVVENWKKLGYEPEIINLEKICRRRSPLTAGRQRCTGRRRALPAAASRRPRKNRLVRVSSRFFSPMRLASANC